MSTPKLLSQATRIATAVALVLAVTAAPVRTPRVGRWFIPPQLLPWLLCANHDGSSPIGCDISEFVSGGAAQGSPGRERREFQRDNLSGSFLLPSASYSISKATS